MAKDYSNKLNLISNKISKDLSKTEYERAINFFNDTNSYMMINDINLSIKEMIDLINNNDRLREMIIVVFNSNLNDILELLNPLSIILLCNPFTIYCILSKEFIKE